MKTARPPLGEPGSSLLINLRMYIKIDDDLSMQCGRQIHFPIETDEEAKTLITFSILIGIDTVLVTIILYFINLHPDTCWQLL